MQEGGADSTLALTGGAGGGNYKLSPEAIAVVVIAYNRPQYLDEALKSINASHPGETSFPVYVSQDGENVPVRHFGVILDLAAWRILADRLEAAGVDFILPPQVRFQGQPGEQATLFFLDPSGNALEFKAFADDASVFAR